MGTDKTAPLTDAEIAAAEVACEHATSGPWFVWASQPDVQVRHGPCDGPQGTGKLLAQVDVWTARGFFDADFMVQARACLPRALAEVRRLREEVARLERVCARKDELLAEAKEVLVPLIPKREVEAWGGWQGRINEEVGKR